MAGLSEKEKLERYTEALDGLPVGLQAVKISAVKSPVNLRRFVSKDAPDRLVSRFAMRVREVMDGDPDDMTFFEYGRMLFFSHRFKEADYFFTAAIMEGEHEAAYEIGRLMMIEGKYELARKFFGYAVDHGVKVDDSMSMIGTALMLLDEKEQARGYFKYVIDKGTGEKAVYSHGMLRIMDGDIGFGEAQLMDCLESGDESAGVYLLMNYKRRGDAEALRRVLGQMVKIGIVSMYLPLAQMNKAIGDDQGVLACCRNAVVLKVPGAVKYFLDYCVATGRREMAESFVEEQIKKGDYQLLNFMTSLYMRTGRIKEALRCCERLYRDGKNRDAEKYLRSHMGQQGGKIYVQLIEAMSQGESFCDELISAVSEYAVQHNIRLDARILN